MTSVGIQKIENKDGDDEILYWQEKYVTLIVSLLLIFKLIIDNYFRLLKEIYNRTIKPWLQMEWIFSLTESRKQMYTAQKNILDFIYSVNF